MTFSSTKSMELEKYSMLLKDTHSEKNQNRILRVDWTAASHVPCQQCLLCILRWYRNLESVYSKYVHRAISASKVASRGIWF